MNRRRRELFSLKIVNVVLASLLVGWFAHELFHVLTMSSVSSISFHFGSNRISTVCCLQPLEETFEGVAYIIQAITTVGWGFFSLRKLEANCVSEKGRL